MNTELENHFWHQRECFSANFQQSGGLQILQGKYVANILSDRFQNEFRDGLWDIISSNSSYVN